MFAASLYAGTTTETRPKCWRRLRVARARRRCRRAYQSCRTRRSSPTARATASSTDIAADDQAAPCCAQRSTCPRRRSPVDASGGGGSCSAPDTVVNRYPGRPPRSRLTASTVWLRSPPLSWNITTAPAPPAGVASRTMASTPGSCQSLLSRSVSTVRYPSRPACAMARSSASVTESGVDEYGGRISRVCRPVAAAIAPWVAASSNRRRSAPVEANCTCVYVCTPSS
jgi:hypothetical protein